MIDSIKHIMAIGRAERLLIFRTAKFWVLSGIGLLVVTLFIFGTTMATILDNNPPGEFMLQGTDALLAMYLFSFLQAILIIFIASDFRKTELNSRLDQVMYSRPVNTTSWVIGKYWGVVSSVIYLNLVLIILASIGRFFKWWFMGASFGLLPAFTYIVIATIPAILFMTALVFFFVSGLRLQALAIILPLGFVAAILFYFQSKFLGFFDYACFTLPLFASDLIGFADLGYLLHQRLFYTLLSFALIAFSISLFPRPVDNKRLHRGVFAGGIILLAISIFVVLNTIHIDQEKQAWRKSAYNDQKAMMSEPGCRVVHYDFDINLFDEPAPLHAKVVLTIENPNANSIDQLIFSLNQNLKIKAVKTLAGDDLPFDHRYNVLRISLTEPLDPAASMKLSVEYAGNIDAENYMLDRIPDQNDIIEKREGPFLKSSISAWLGNKYAILPMEVGWYPIPGVVCGYDKNHRRPKNFATARIQISSPENLHFITQGREIISDSARHRAEYVVEQPVPGFSLNAGPYQKMIRKFPQAEFVLYFHPQHLPAISQFAEIADTCFEAVETLFDEYETVAGIAYPYPRLSFVETPTQMQIYLTESGINNILLQPGVIMLDETAITGHNIKIEIEERQKRAKRRGRDDSDKKIKRDVFIDFMLDFLLPSKIWQADGTIYSPLKNYFHFQMDIQDPVLSRALEVQYLELCEKRVYDTFFPREEKRRFSNFDELRNLNSGWAIRRRYNVVLDSLITTMENTPLTALKPVRNGGLYRAAMDFKSPQILEMLRNLVGEKNWQKGMQKLLEQYRYQKVTREDLLRTMQLFQANVSQDFFVTWFDKPTYPGYKILSAKAQKLKPRGSRSIKMAYQVKVKIRNGEEGAGFVRLRCRMKGDDAWRKIFLDSFEEKEVQFPVYAKPEEIELYPYYARNRGKIRKSVQINDGLLRRSAIDSVFVVTHALSDSLNFVLDDQGDEFASPVQDEAKYFRPALKGKSWQARISDVAYGDYYLSWHFKRAASGEYPARWEAKIPKSGTYSLSYRLPYGKTWFLRPRYFVDELIFKITTAEGVQRLKLEPFETSDDWLPMGQFYFEKEKPAIVEIIDKGNGRLVADAIRWEFIN